MVTSDDATPSIRIILRGAGTKGQPTAPGMPSYVRQLDENRIAAVLTPIRNNRDGAAEPVTSEQVSKVYAFTKSFFQKRVTSLMHPPNNYGHGRQQRVRTPAR